MNTLEQQIEYLRKQLDIRDSQVLNNLLNSYSNAQISLQNQLVKQQQRIDKAIEYITHEWFKREQIGISHLSFSYDELQHILDILRGNDNE